MESYLSTEIPDIEQFIVNHVEYTLARSRMDFDDEGAFQATAFSLRDRLIEFWNDTQQYFHDQKAKKVYYLSIEYLLGRSMRNTVTNLNLKGEYAQALHNLGYTLEDLYDYEVDAGLGNGGLGRLAACFLDSLASMNYPGWGYGIRYQYGMFKQDIKNGWQVETPDYWLQKVSPWEIRRNDINYPIRFGGEVRTIVDSSSGFVRFIWEGGELITAQAYDVPVPGYKTANTINLRLWQGVPNMEFDLESFNQGDYYAALKAKEQSENITSVLYPNDKTTAGKELRLKQEYFFVSASLHDIIHNYRRTIVGDNSFAKFADHVAIQLNDTHPTIAIPELLRLLMDEYTLGWEQAWDIITKVFAYTNHTVLPEALEKWPVDVISRLLPRHMEIIYEINRRHLEQIFKKWPGDVARQRELSIIEEGTVKQVRMAYLAIIGSHSVNGVAALHTEILKQTLFKGFYEMWPEKFNNKTNGVTPRRWMLEANPGLTTVISKILGHDDWIRDLDKLAKLRPFAGQTDVQKHFMTVKHANKVKVAELIKRMTGIVVDPHALFDVHIKRIHEYKRQLLNILGVIHRYLTLKKMTAEQRNNTQARVVIFGGKAAPAYTSAKHIIKLITSVADVVNHDTDISNALKVVFLPNYNVSMAEAVIPASDISQHISTAGTEASGTSNMKFAMNGGLILGTLDGANIEILEEIGDNNMFIFGTKAEHVDEVKKLGPRVIDSNLYAVLKSVYSGVFGNPENYKLILEQLWHGADNYLVAQDFPSYIEAQNQIDEVYKNKSEWAKRCIETVAGMGKFSSDRTIHDYAKEIWGIKPCPFPFKDVIYHK
eukprot:TRINITY_DN337_c0_g1_i1.p1 TRINITY_DN337_c0_g1~~TRINITY_DN337_c0_g1_i1.p1  ORF type:complete len:916 (+),score=254.59 TRINITY_DN337_c0_g1_i1:272-2749(+)